MHIPEAVVMFGKAALYPTLFGLAARRWKPTLELAPWRFVFAGLLRFALGWAVMIPVGLLLFDSHGGPAAPLAFQAARFVLWLGLAKLFFWPVRAQELLGFAAVATLLNMALDLVLFPEGLQAAFHINMC